MRVKYAAAVAVLATGCPAMAQSDLQSPLIPQNVGIKDKIADDYKPVGGRVGTVMIYPEATATGTYTDNVLATKRDRDSDEYLTVRPGVRFVSIDGVNRYNLQTYFSRDFHVERQLEDVSRFGGIFAGRIGLPTDSHLDLTASAQRLVDSREDINNVDAARTPVHRGRFAGELAYTQALGKFSVLGAANASAIDFANATDRSGNEIDQHYRDYHSFGGRTEVRYGIAKGIMALGKFSYDLIRYPFGPGSPGFDQSLDRDRDSRRVRAEGGFGFSINDILYGDATIGYLDRKYRPQPVPLRNVGGFSFDVDMLWNVTPLTTLRVKAARDFLESSSRTIAGYRTTGGTLELSHSPFHSLIVTAALNLADFKPIGGEGNARFEYGGQVTATYILSRRYSLEAEYRRAGRNARNENFAYDGNYISAGLRVTL